MASSAAAMSFNRIFLLLSKAAASADRIGEVLRTPESWKRRSSQASLRRALMTRTPAAFSRMTRVIRSTSCCTRSYRGTPFRETKITIAVITGASTHSTEASAASMVSATHTPPTSMMGARTPTVWLEVIKF